MKRVTGNNQPQSANKVSIRLAPGGHSFLAEALNAQDVAEVEIELLTARSMLVPTEIFDADSVDDASRTETGRNLLAANGTPLGTDECAVWSHTFDGVAAVMAADAQVVRTIRATLGGRERFTTPLLRTPQTTVPTVWMYYAAGLLYIKVYDDGALRLAEVTPTPTAADILYFTELLGREFQLGKFELHIVAEQPNQLRKLIGGRFKRSTCENLK